MHISPHRFFTRRPLGVTERLPIWPPRVLAATAGVKLDPALPFPERDELTAQDRASITLDQRKARVL